MNRIIGSERMLFDTDHPFFLPLSPTEKWRSVLDNLEAIHNRDGNGWGEEAIIVVLLYNMICRARTEA
jgi:hypothetical protein